MKLINISSTEARISRFVCLGALCHRLSPEYRALRPLDYGQSCRYLSITAVVLCHAGHAFSQCQLSFYESGELFWFSPPDSNELLRALYSKSIWVRVVTRLNSLLCRNIHILHRRLCVCRKGTRRLIALCIRINLSNHFLRVKMVMSIPAVINHEPG